MLKPINIYTIFLGFVLFLLGRFVWFTLQRRHNERNRVSNHRCIDCLLKRLFTHRSKKASKLREGDPSVIDGFPSQTASNAENHVYIYYIDLLELMEAELRLFGVRVMCCSAPSLYLNQCWIIVNWTLGEKNQWNSNKNEAIFVQELKKNEFQNIASKMAAVLSRPQCILVSYG